MTSFSSASGRSARSNGQGRAGSSDPVGTLDPSATYIADTFTITLQDDWDSNTVYRLEGPMEDGLQHVLQINVHPDVGGLAVVDYAAREIERQVDILKQGQLLARSRTALDNGQPASRVVFSMVSGSDRPLYQEDWYLVEGEAGYRLSARFTEKSLPLVAPTVERICRSFAPHRPLCRRR